MNLCQIAKPRDYQKLLQMNVCFDIQQALKLTLMYRKYNSFMYLLSNIKFKEQLNYLYHHRNNSTTTLMAIATIQGYYKGVKRLIKDGANIHNHITISGGDQMNYLMYVCSNHNFAQEMPRKQKQILKTVLLLVDHGININYQSNTGTTALMVAAKTGNIALYYLLIKLGANQTLTDMYTKSAMDYFSIDTHKPSLFS